ncbi:MAG TPA: formate dehydrogenase accessory sulfurtransferase FdhD [Sphingomonas sp.]|nr:formate dehydrogenase accessory sulfurtransferase FdhD [Sphingomonas sp.]
MASEPRPVKILAPDATRAAERAVAVEAPVAVEVNGLGYAVMMMTPAAFGEFATGFMLTERLADTPADIRDIHVADTPAGTILRVTLAEHCADRIHDRVRHRSSDTGCGLCGIAGLEQVVRPLPAPPPRPDATPAALFAALAGLREHQPLNRATGAVHAAAWCDSAGAVRAVFEDVGRHNALDKLIGHAARTHAAFDGFLLVTSRISFEMVDKALVARAPLLVGISAPTTMAIDHARAYGLTLVALARDDAMLVANDPFGAFVSG